MTHKKPTFPILKGFTALKSTNTHNLIVLLGYIFLPRVKMDEARNVSIDSKFLVLELKNGVVD